MTDDSLSSHTLTALFVLGLWALPWSSSALSKLPPETVQVRELPQTKSPA